MSQRGSTDWPRQSGEHSAESLGMYNGPHAGVQPIKVPEMQTFDETACVSDLDIGFNERVGEELVTAVEDLELPMTLETIVCDDGVLGDRPMYMWKWIYHVTGDLLMLPTVAESFEEIAHEAKFLVGVYVTLVDDLAERHDDKFSFWELSKAFYPKQEPEWDHSRINDEYARSAKVVWEELTDRLKTAPMYNKYADVFKFDFRSCVQAMDFARVSDQFPGSMHQTETWKFETLAIGQFPVVDVDLMFSPEFDPAEFSELRGLIHELQRMWRIGNWAITWEREAHEGDFSAGVFVEAIDQGILTERQLESLDPEEIVSRIEQSGIVERFMADWKRRRDRLYEQDFEMRSLNSNDLVESMEELMLTHLAREGHC